MLEIIAKIADVMGILGVILLLIAYFYLNTNRLTSLHLSYQWLNFFGSAFILISLCFQWNTASVLIESAWIGISAIGLYRIIQVKSSSSSDDKNASSLSDTI